MGWRSIGLIVALLGTWTPAVQAQSYPNRVIKLIVPFTPGSPVDATARVVTQHLQPRIGQNFIIENRAGGGTSIGVRAVATAQPDGYTLLLNGSSTVWTSRRSIQARTMRLCEISSRFRRL